MLVGMYIIVHTYLVEKLLLCMWQGYCYLVKRNVRTGYFGMFFGTLFFFFCETTSKALILNRECVRAGAVGARTRRYLGHHLLHPLILKLLVLCTF